MPVGHLANFFGLSAFDFNLCYRRFQTALGGPRGCDFVWVVAVWLTDRSFADWSCEETATDARRNA
jgi:hypothetical protein